LYKTSVTKKRFRGHNVLQTAQVLNVFFNVFCNNSKFLTVEKICLSFTNISDKR